jgi:hypothetical protein
MEVQLELGILSQWGTRAGASDSNYPAINRAVMIHLRDGKPVEGARVRVYSAIISLKAQAGERSREMKNAILCTATMVFVALFSGCASMQTWPDSERSAENKMVVIQEKIGMG